MNLFYFKKDTKQEIVLNEHHMDLLCNLGFMNRYQLAMAWAIVFDYPTAPSNYIIQKWTSFHSLLLKRSISVGSTKRTYYVPSLSCRSFLIDNGFEVEKSDSTRINSHNEQAIEVILQSLYAAKYKGLLYQDLAEVKSRIKVAEEVSRNKVAKLSSQNVLAIKNSRSLAEVRSRIKVADKQAISEKASHILLSSLVDGAIAENEVTSLLSDVYLVPNKELKAIDKGSTNIYRDSLRKFYSNKDSFSLSASLFVEEKASSDTAYDANYLDGSLLSNNTLADNFEESANSPYPVVDSSIWVDSPIKEAGAGSAKENISKAGVLENEKHKEYKEHDEAEQRKSLKLGWIKKYAWKAVASRPEPVDGMSEFSSNIVHSSDEQPYPTDPNQGYENLQDDREKLGPHWAQKWAKRPQWGHNLLKRIQKTSKSWGHIGPKSGQKWAKRPQ